METDRIKKIIFDNAPCYIYDSSLIESQIAEMKDAFPDYKVLYSIKTNPHEGIIRIMAGHGLGSDASSAGEVQASLDAGIPAEEIYYSSVGKTEQDINESLGNCRLIADSLNEMRVIERVASEKDVQVGIGVRINPDFMMAGDCSAAAFRKPYSTETDHDLENGGLIGYAGGIDKKARLLQMEGVDMDTF